MKKIIFIWFLVLANYISNAQNNSIDSLKTKMQEVKLIPGLPKFLENKFDSSTSRFFYASIPNLTNEYCSTFIYQRENDGVILYWWNEYNNEKTDLTEIFPNDFSKGLPSFTFVKSKEEDKILTTTHREISLLKTEKIYVNQSVDTEKLVNTSKIKFYVSPSIELQAFLAKYINNQRNMPANTVKKEFWKILNHNRDVIMPIHIAHIGFKTLFLDRNAIEAKIGIALNDNEEYMSLELGLFYNYFWSSNLFSFVGAQTRGGHRGSASLNANYYGGGIGYGLNESIAITLGVFLAEAETYYSYFENSNVTWKYLFRLGFQFNY